MNAEGRGISRTSTATQRKEKRAWLSPLLLAGLCLCGLLSEPQARAQSLDDYLGKPIIEVKVVVEGSPAREAGEAFRSLLRVREGAAYSVAEVRRSLLQLYDSGRVANARVEAELSGTGTVSVTFFIMPQVRVGAVEFDGLVDADEEDLRARLTDLERGARFSEANVRRGAERVYETMKARGYYQVNVEPQVQYDQTRTVATITYRVTAGALATLAAINFTGSSKIPEAALRAEMESRIGAAFSRVRLSADLQRLLELHLAGGYLSAQVGPPDISYSNADNAVTVILPIVSGPNFAVKVEGYEIKEKKLRELLPMLREGGINVAALEESARRLRDYLQEEGFFFAEVEPPPLPDLAAEQAELVFAATPNNRYRVTAIRIEGTNQLSFAEVADDLRSKEESFFPVPIFSRYTRGITSEQALRRDADVILTRLRDLGFRRARLVSINRAVGADNDRLTIIFNVEEGPRSFIGEVAFRGNTLLTSDRLREMIELRPGEPYSLSRIKIEGNKILQHYFDQGYASASVQGRPSELGGERVRVTYEITEGPLIYVNRILINNTGLRQRTRSGRVSAFLRFAPGSRLLNDEVALSEQDLYAVGAFRRVQIRSEPLGEESEVGAARRDVHVDLDEGKSRIFVYGAGYQSDEGARGILEVSDPNIFGRLTTVSLRLRGSNRNLLGQLSYADPRPFNFNIPALFSLLLQRQQRPAFDSRRATVLLQVERRLNDQSLLLFRYNYEDVRVTNPASITDRRDQPVRLSRLSASYAFDGRDNPFDAAAGRYHSADFSIAVRALGGNEQFARFFTENQLYYTVPRSGGVVLAGNLRLGLAKNIGTRADLPPDLTASERALLPLTERFFSGGSTTLRGYNFEQAGPRDTNNRPLGGNALVIFNAELRRAVYRQIALVGFYDGGNVFRKINDIGLQNFTHTIGAGLRLKTPLGPFRIDVGYLVSDPFKGSGLPPSVTSGLRLPRWRFHLSFGQAF
jgi:outer membrane protein insertion porin family